MGRRWRAVLGTALVLAAVVFLGLTIARNWTELQAFEWQIRWAPLLGSVPALTAALVWGVFVWKLVLDRFDPAAVPFPALLRIWFLSNLARYIPGKIWQFVGAAELARVAGLSRALILTSLVVHMGFTLLAAAVVSALVLIPAGLPGEVPAVALVAVALLSLLLVHPRVFDVMLGLGRRLLGREMVAWRGGWRDGVVLLMLAVVSWLVYGAAFTLFVASMIDITAAAVLTLAAINALAFLAGYLVFLAPAGLGAREGAMAVLLRPFAPAGVAAVVAVAARLWTVAGELLGAGLVLALEAIRARGTGRR